MSALTSTFGFLKFAVVVINNMENTSEQSRDQPVAGKRVKVEETDGKSQSDNKGEGSAISGVTDTQWRSMMDVVMAIYEFREEE